MSLTASIKSIQDIMRKDVGVDGDAQPSFPLPPVLPAISSASSEYGSERTRRSQHLQEYRLLNTMAPALLITRPLVPATGPWRGVRVRREAGIAAWPGFPFSISNPVGMACL